MVPVTLRESGIGARAKVKAHHGNHPPKRRREVIWTGIEKGTVTETEVDLMIQKAGGVETGSARRVEVEKGMIMIELQVEKKTGIEGEGEMRFGDERVSQ